MRNLNIIEQLITEVDTALRTIVTPKNRSSNRSTPAQNIPEASLTSDEKRNVAGLMRVNHAGEVCAQALYQGQALTAKLPDVRAQMNEAALEEVDHLAWCEQRLSELDNSPSILNPIWYAGSFLLGAIAGLAGDHISLSFVAETERQVTQHLQKHRQIVPSHDLKTHAILANMEEDEALHAKSAIAAGGSKLPWIIQKLMGRMSSLLTFSSYYV